MTTTLFWFDINLTSLYQDDGLTLAQEIIDNGCSSKVVILTGYSKKCMNTELKLWGLMAFWTKVWTLDELVKNWKKIYLGGKVFSDEVMVEVEAAHENEGYTNLTRSMVGDKLK